MPEAGLERLSAAELLAELRRSDVRCWAEGGRLRLDGPRHVLNAELREQLARRKTELLALLGAGGGASRPPLHRAARDGHLPLSFAQQRMWFLQRLEPESVAYNLQTSVPFTGPLDEGALARSLSEVVRRHEILRTTFAEVDGQPVQRLAPPAPVELAVEDLRDRTEGARAEEAQRRRGQEVRRPFDLERGPLFRPLLLRLGPGEHELLLTQHHILTDGWSIAILIEEILALYAAFRVGHPSPLPDPVLHYGDFASAQREWLQGEVLEPHLSYWRRQLAGLPTLDLPTDRPRPAVQSYEGAIQWLELPADLSEGLRALARREGATLFMVLLAALQALLSRYTGQEDVAVGVPSGTRAWVETERMLGLFLNTLVMRTDLSGDPPFRELLARAMRVALDASAHEELPFERLVEELRPARDLSRSPLFQVLFILQNTPLQSLARRPRPGQKLLIETGTASFDLTLYVMDTEDGLRGYLEYATALFDHATAARLIAHFETLLRGVVADPRRRLSALPLAPPAELETILHAWNETRAEYPRACVHELVAARAARTPEATAVVGGERALTYRELDRRATQLAHRLRRLGAGPGARIGVCLERSVEMAVGLLGILKAGAAYVPLDPAFPAARLAFMLDDARLALVLTESRLTDVLPRAGLRPVLLDRHEVLEGEPEDASALPAVAPENLAYVMYTSGSTGRPKGVEVEHRGLANFLASMGCEPGLSETDVLVSVTTFSFDIAGLELYLPLLAGARLVLASREVAQDGRRLADLIAASHATILQATPATWRMLIESGWDGSPGLTMLCGGETLPRELARQLLARGRALFNLYGPTETTIWSTVERVTPGEGPVMLGRPLANTRLYVLDARGEPTPLGVPGELFIGGDGVARGYLRQPELTAERFVPDPFGSRPGARLYRTGDRVRLGPDRSLEYLGRADHQVKIRGFRVELGEIEAVLAAHPAVEAAVVAVREVAGDRQLAAYVVFRREQPTVTELRRYLKRSLPAHMVPSSFAVLDAMPLTGSGKVDRRALVALGTRAEGDEGYVAPRTPMERLVASVWAEALGRDRVGVRDNFFDLGGHSLLSLRVLARIEERVGCRLGPRELMFQTLEQFAATCEEHARLAPPERARALAAGEGEAAR